MLLNDSSDTIEIIYIYILLLTSLTRNVKNGVIMNHSLYYILISFASVLSGEKPSNDKKA